MPIELRGVKLLENIGKRSDGHIQELKGNTKMHHEDLGSDTAVCITHDRVV